MKKQVDVENANIVPRDDYAETLETIIAGGFCPFCEEHLFKHHRKPLMYTTKHWLVTESSWPYKGSRFHILFIARPHIESTEDMPTTMWVELLRLYRALVREKKIEGATLIIRSGNTQITGATVNHLHAHLIVGAPRTESSKPIKALVGFEE